ncbi:hypothetical protein ACSQ67_000459 [Phaseolus vulgaris]
MNKNKGGAWRTGASTERVSQYKGSFTEMEGQNGSTRKGEKWRIHERAPSPLMGEVEQFGSGMACRREDENARNAEDTCFPSNPKRESHLRVSGDLSKETPLQIEETMFDSFLGEA